MKICETHRFMTIGEHTRICVYKIIQDDVSSFKSSSDFDLLSWGHECCVKSRQVDYFPPPPTRHVFTARKRMIFFVGKSRE